MGFFGSGDKIQTDTTNQTGASESAQQNLGAGQAVKDDGIAVGGYQSTLQAAGAIKSDGLGNVLNVTDGGAFDLVKYIAGLQSETLTGSLAAVKEQAVSSGATQSSLLSSVVESLAALSESKQTDGQSGLNKTFMYAVFAVAAVAAIYFWKKK